LMDGEADGRGGRCDGDAADHSTQLEEVARRANVPSEFARRLAALGALSEDLSTASK
jgi:hypothetical protein